MKIAIWYHCRLFDGDPPIDPDFAIPLMSEQMQTLKVSGLEAAAHEIVICVNGNTQNRIVARQLAPAKSRFIDHGRDAFGLLSTVNCLREWAQTHSDWLVCFWHIKGVTHPGDQLNQTWRKCMEQCVILNWRQCVADLNAGYETVGAHWLTPKQFPGIVKLPFWGGQFFWAKASFLAELPALPSNPARREDWFLSENWIGMGRLPKVIDYAPHWPGLNTCASTFQWAGAIKASPAMVSFDSLLSTMGTWRGATWRAAADCARRLRFTRFIETGCFRGTAEDGYSTLLLAALAGEMGGHLDSYEINPNNIKTAKRALDQQGLQSLVTFHQGDSVTSLAASTAPIDFAYLDSFDCGDLVPSQKHQLAEVEAVLPMMQKQSALLLDDHMADGGKTKLSMERLKRRGYQSVVVDYQVLFESQDTARLPKRRIAVLSGHLPNYAPLAAQTIYHHLAQYCLRHDYELRIIRSVDAEFTDSDSKYCGFSWARMKEMLRLVESGAYEWVWCVGCDVLITNQAMPLNDLLEHDRHLVICGERVAPLQADSFLVRCSPQGAQFLRRILSLYEQYKNHPWIDNQAMIDLKKEHDPITQIVPQHRLNAFDYKLFYHLGDIYRSGQDCYGNRGQWQQGDFVIHWPAHDLNQRMNLLRQYEPLVVA